MAASGEYIVERCCQAHSRTSRRIWYLDLPYGTFRDHPPVGFLAQSSRTRSRQDGIFVLKPSPRIFGSSACSASGSPCTTKTVLGNPASPVRLAFAKLP